MHEQELQKLLVKRKKELEQKKTRAEKLHSWTMGVALATSALLIAATLLVVFFPPATAIILPIITASGSWSFLFALTFALTAFLPTLCLNKARRSQVNTCEKLQSEIDKLTFSISCKNHTNPTRSVNLLNENGVGSSNQYTDLFSNSQMQPENNLQDDSATNARTLQAYPTS